VPPIDPLPYSAAANCGCCHRAAPERVGWPRRAPTSGRSKTAARSKKFDCYLEGTIIFGQLGVLANLQAAFTPTDGAKDKRPGMNPADAEPCSRLRLQGPPLSRELRHLRYFVALALAGNFPRREQLFIDQHESPAGSRGVSS